MSLFRSRIPEAVRRDALRLATRKAEEGCSGCAEAYLEVARRASAGDEEVDRTRRSIFKRAGLLAGAGLAVSLVDLGGVASGALAAVTPQPKLGGWHADYGTAVQSVLDSRAYRRAREHLSGMGVATLEQGSIFFVPAGHVPGLERPTYSVVQPFDGGHPQAHVTQDGQSSAVVTVDGRSRFGGHFDERGARLGEKQERFTGRSTGGQLPPGRLLPGPGPSFSGRPRARSRRPGRRVPATWSASSSTGSAAGRSASSSAPSAPSYAVSSPAGLQAPTSVTRSVPSIAVPFPDSPSGAARAGPSPALSPNLDARCPTGEGELQH